MKQSASPQIMFSRGVKLFTPSTQTSNICSTEMSREMCEVALYLVMHDNGSVSKPNNSFLSLKLIKIRRYLDFVSPEHSGKLSY